jgi:hypothetical protein
MTDWCLCNSGVKQGDNLLPILFSIFIDDLVDEINELGLGVNIGDSKLNNSKIFIFVRDLQYISSNPELRFTPLFTRCSKTNNFRLVCKYSK